MQRILSGLFIAISCGLAGATATSAQEAPKVDFAREVRPILARRCFSCHGPNDSKAGLRLDQFEGATKPLESSSSAIVPGKLEDSELWHRINSHDEAERMPPEGNPLTEAQIQILKRWIESGAKYEAHWAFRKPISHPAPEVRQKDWVKNEIDAFILARLEANGLKPNPQAEPLALLRRVCYDLTGLPPTAQQIAAFQKDPSPVAYEKLVDELLQSPHYGERWGRHWLDVVRFAETNSFERDGVKPNAWKYRDYVIRSLNADKPYDVFLREQLAGDEMPNATPDQIIAAGFYRLGLWDDEPADAKQARYDELDDVITTVGQGFLALTMNCARCHDHKIDPVSQADYYKLLAFFNELTPYGTRGDQTSWNQRDLGDPSIAQAYAEKENKLRELRDRIHRLEQEGIKKMSGEDQRKTEGREREKVLREKLKDFLEAPQWEEYTRLKMDLEEVTKRALPHREMALSVSKCYVPAPETFVLPRGNPHAQGAKVQPGYPEIFGDKDPQIPAVKAEAYSSGLRTELARWITSPENPLTSRVIMNRLWQHHFGRGIVRSPNNFGQLGEPPTHPELLDWLSQKLIAEGWHLKPLHKLIVMSNTYQMSSRGQPEGLAKDPANQLFWRYDMRRLGAEELRDTLYVITGEFNPKMFGPGIYTEIPREVLEGQSVPGSGWGKSSPEEQARRSVYIHVKRSLISPLLLDFDFPETDTSCAARFNTTQPAQALSLINSEFIQERARKFAARLKKEKPDNEAGQIRLALETALQRPVHEDEVQRGQAFLAQLREKHKLSAEQALERYCLLVLNLNETVYLD